MDTKDSINDKHLEQIMTIGTFKEDLAGDDEANRQISMMLKT